MAKKKKREKENGRYKIYVYVQTPQGRMVSVSSETSSARIGKNAFCLENSDKVHCRRKEKKNRKTKEKKTKEEKVIVLK